MITLPIINLACSVNVLLSLSHHFIMSVEAAEPGCIAQLPDSGPHFGATLCLKTSSIWLTSSWHLQFAAVSG